MATSTEPGKRRKECPGCHSYVGFRTLVCPTCQHDFKTGAPKVATAARKVFPAMPPDVPVDTSEIDDGDGDGDDEQEATQLAIDEVDEVDEVDDEEEELSAKDLAAFRSRVSKLNFDEERKEELREERKRVKKVEPARRKPVPDNVSTMPLRSVSIPAGECPIKLHGTEVEQVAAWADKVLEHFLARSESLSVEGLMYFVQTIYDSWTPECKLVQGHLEQLFAN